MGANFYKNSRFGVHIRAMILIVGIVRQPLLWPHTFQTLFRFGAGSGDLLCKDSRFGVHTRAMILIVGVVRQPFAMAPRIPDTFKVWCRLRRSPM